MTRASHINLAELWTRIEWLRTCPDYYFATTNEILQKINNFFNEENTFQQNT